MTSTLLDVGHFFGGFISIRQSKKISYLLVMLNWMTDEIVNLKNIDNFLSIYKLT